MERFEIYEVSAGTGRLGICPMPGRDGRLEADLQRLFEWHPSLVLTMTSHAELARAGAHSLSDQLHAQGCQWHHLPIEDFGAPSGDTAARWAEVSTQARALLTSGHRVLAHCWGGQGRSGMAALRLLVELGEAPETALGHIRTVRPGAVETAAQFAWAARASVSKT